MTEKDLLGDPIEPTPAMTAPLPWRVFHVNDHECWVARSMQEAKATAAESWGMTLAEAEAGGEFDDAAEITDARMHELMVTDDESFEHRTVSFRTHLDRLIERGLSAPEFFCGEDY